MSNRAICHTSGLVYAAIALTTCAGMARGASEAGAWSRQNPGQIEGKAGGSDPSPSAPFGDDLRACFRAAHVASIDERSDQAISSLREAAKLVLLQAGTAPSDTDARALLRSATMLEMLTHRFGRGPSPETTPAKLERVFSRVNDALARNYLNRANASWVQGARIPAGIDLLEAAHAVQDGLGWAGRPLEDAPPRAVADAIALASRIESGQEVSEAEYNRSATRLEHEAGVLKGLIGGAVPDGDGVTNIVLVHGAWVDASGWKPVFEILTREGFDVTMVQEPETSFADDVAATRRILDLQNGPSILVGHSYGGSIITEAGTHPSVVGLVYVAAHAPDIGEDEGKLGKGTPSVLGKTPGAIRKTPDGFTYLDPSLFAKLFAPDLDSKQAEFESRSQVLAAGIVFSTPMTQAAWRTKPSWGIVAGGDQIINPDLERFYYRRARSEMFVIDGASHSVYESHPNDVAAVIIAAARSFVD